MSLEFNWYKSKFFKIYQVAWHIPFKYHDLLWYQDRRITLVCLPVDRPAFKEAFKATTTATATKPFFKKYIHAASNFIKFIPSRSIRQIIAIFSGVEF